MFCKKSVRTRLSVLLCPSLLLAIADPVLAKRTNEVIRDEVITHPGIFSFYYDYINPTIKDGGHLAILPGCHDDNCDDYSYATAEGATVTGDSSELRVGGTANNTTVENGGTILVAESGFGAVINNGMTWDKFPAEINNTTVKDGGIEMVYGNGTSNNSTIEAGGKQYIFIETGNQYTNPEGGTAIDASINGGTQYIYGTGAKAIGSTINDNGSQYIYNTGVTNHNGGGYAENTTINNGTQFVYGVDSQAAKTTINSQGVQHVYDNGLVTDTTIDGGLQRVYTNKDGAGKAENTVVNSGSQYVYKDGLADNNTINGGSQMVFNGGRATNTTVNSGGVQQVQNEGSIATNNIINSGGSQRVWNGATIQDTTVNGGYSQIDAGGISQGTLDITQGGTLALQSSTSQTSTIANATIDSQSNLQLLFNSASADSGDSFINITNLENNGVASFGAMSSANTRLANGFEPMTLNIDNLQGNGLYAMRADIGGGVGDLIRINELDADSSNQLFIANNGAASASIDDVLTVVATNSGGNADQFSLYQAVEQGGYEFGLRQDGNDWVLCADASCTRGPANPDGGSLSSTAQAAGNFLNTSYLMSYINTQNLMQRMGDLRNSDNTKEVDVWMRGFAGKLNSFGGKLGGFDMNYRGTQVGVDKRINLTSGALRVGVAAGYTDADPNYRSGSGGVRSYNFGIYSTYMSENDFYVDALLKYDRIKNNFSVTDTQANKISGKARSNGYGFSVEAGKRFYLQQPDSGFYLEPQVQLSYMHQEGDTVHASNGLKVKLSDYDSTLGRVSTAIGYEIKDGANPINVYFKTGYVREFTGDNINYYLNNSKEKHSFKGNFWDNEVGVSMTINNRHTLHADLSYANGNRFDKQQINVGYRFSF